MTPAVRTGLEQEALDADPVRPDSVTSTLIHGPGWGPEQQAYNPEANGTLVLDLQVAFSTINITTGPS